MLVRVRQKGQGKKRWWEKEKGERGDISGLREVRRGGWVLLLLACERRGRGGQGGLASETEVRQEKRRGSDTHTPGDLGLRWFRGRSEPAWTRNRRRRRPRGGKRRGDASVSMSSAAS